MITNPHSATTGEELPQNQNAETSPAANQEAEPSTSAPDLGAAEQSQEADNSIPEKFRGKSAQEIARAYKEVERHAGKLSTEKAHAEKQAEELQQRLQAMEQQLQQISYQQQQQPPASATEPDPFASIEEEFEQDPRAAFKKLVNHVTAAPKQLESRIEMRNRAQAAVDYYQQQMKENPEFRELEPEMKRLAGQFSGVVRPEFINSKESMQLLFQLAKGSNIDRFTKAAAEKAIQANNLVKAEKRSAVSESSGASAGERSVPFEDLSLEEMAKALGRVGH